MEKNNTLIWDTLFKTDPNYTKKFDKGTYKGTAINPMYVYKKLTEQFGACGIGWKVEIIDTQTQHFQDGAVIVSQTVKLFIKNGSEWSDGIVGTGGDYIRRITNKGSIMVDDDGYKKALTDAITNATKMLGMSGDVYMGLYDDNKYVSSLEDEFKEKPQVINEVQLQTLENLMKEVNQDRVAFLKYYGIEKLEDMPSTSFLNAKSGLEKKKANQLLEKHNDANG